MSVLLSKWVLGISAILLTTIALLYITGSKSVHSEVVVPASLKLVWAVLIDTERYKKWNSVLVPLEGELREGGEVLYEFHQDSDKAYKITSKVVQVSEETLLNQRGGMQGILTFDHRYQLEPTHNGTKVIIHEEYRGIGVHFWDPAPVEAAYHRLNQALKDRVIEVYPQ